MEHEPKEVVAMDESAVKEDDEGNAEEGEGKRGLAEHQKFFAALGDSGVEVARKK